MQQRELLRRRRTTPRVPNLGIASHRAVEALERRTMLCAVHTYHDPAESTAVPDGYQGPDGGGADIIWTNRGTTDNFGNFGAQAETARRVVDAVLVAFERMIGDFNYSNGTNNFNLTLLTSGSGHGASASLNTGTILSGLPKSGTVNMGGGTGGTGGGWFFDPTPEEHSEFQGSIVNAFSGDAQAGSPASGRGDFYTVVAAEVAHCLGLYGSVLPGWAARTTNTGVPDTAEGGGRGTFYAFQGPSIKHLLTSNNGGAGGQNWGSAVHAAGPGVNVSFGGDTYTGAQDIGNAVYEFSRRYIPNRAFSLMFKDAYAYSTVDPDRYGTFYALPATATGNVVVRGGTAASVDTISLSVSGSALLVSVDPLADVPGTGHLPGAGDLPAFVTEYDISQVSSISIASGDGNDTINVDGLPAGVTLTIQAGNGADTINVNETDPAATVVLMPSIGNDAVTINADGAGAAAARFDGTHTLTTLVLGAGGTLSGAGNVTVTNAMTWSGGTMTGTGQTVIAAGATLSVTGTGLRHSDRVIEIGGSAAMDAGGGLVLRTAGLELGPVGALDVRDNALILDYSGAASPLADVQTALTTGYAGGLWSGPGITSSTAAAAASHALGYAEAADVLAAFPATFAGQSVDDTTVLVRYTRNGDANLDGTVNLTDFNKLASSFGQLNTDWAQGNFNFDLTTNLADFNLLASNFGQTAAAASRGSSTGKTGGVSDEDDDQLLA